MEKPKESIDGARVLYWSQLDDCHIVSGSRHRTVDGETRLPDPGVAIGQRLGDLMTYLFFCDAQWNPVTDTLHSNISRAKEEAEREFKWREQDMERHHVRIRHRRNPSESAARAV